MTFPDAMSTEERTSRHTSSMAEAFPVFTPSPEALRRIDELNAVANLETVGPGLAVASVDVFQQTYDILVEDQSKYGMRVHKGFPLFWMSVQVGKSDREKALKLMLEAYVEDVLTHGHRATQGFAASSLKEDFGITVDTLVALKEFALEKTKSTFSPVMLVDEFRSVYKGEAKPKGQFKGVSEESV